MSVEAVTWALGLDIAPSSAKFVLVVIANCASSETMEAYPSTAYLARATNQDRKTVAANLGRLRELGYIEDTGRRQGSTSQVVVYRLNEPENGPVSDVEKTPENGPVEEAQKRNSTENGTVPFFPTNRPNFPHKEARFSPQRGPKTGHGTIRKDKGKGRKGETTFDQWVGSLPEDTDAIPASDPIYGWASDAGIPEDYLGLAWLAFEDRFAGQPKTYADWKAAFRNYVKQGWLKLWAPSRDGGYYLTTSGEQWRQVRDAREAHAMREAA